MLKIVIDGFSSVKNLKQGKNAEVICINSNKVQLSKSDYVKFFKPVLEGGDDVIYLSVSFNLLSDSGAACREAFAEFKKEFPQQKVEFVDTLTVSAATGIIANLCVTAANTGSVYQDVLEYVLNLVGRFAVVFTVDNFENLKTDALFNKVLSAFPGNLVSNKPIFCVDDKGELKLLDKKRGFRAAINAMTKIVKQNGENVADYEVIITHIDAKAEAEALRKNLAEIVGAGGVYTLAAEKALRARLGGVKTIAIAFHMKLMNSEE